VDVRSVGRTDDEYVTNPPRGGCFMSIMPHYLLTALVMAVVIPAHARADDKTPTREELASVKEAARELDREVESLQDILAESDGEKERTVYRLADAVLTDVEGFQKSLKPEISRDRLYKAFDELDRKLQGLLKAVKELGPEQRLLRRPAVKVRSATDHLHYAVSVGDTSESRTKQVLERQTQGLVDAARDLDKTAGYSLGVVPGRAVLAGDLHKLAEATEQFHKGLAAGQDRAQLRKEFVAVNEAWERAIQGMRNLKAGDHVHLLRAAGRFDRLHERVYRLLGIEGERPQLIIRT